VPALPGSRHIFQRPQDAQPSPQGTIMGFGAAHQRAVLRVFPVGENPQKQQTCTCLHCSPVEIDPVSKASGNTAYTPAFCLFTTAFQRVTLVNKGVILSFSAVPWYNDPNGQGGMNMATVSYKKLWKLLIDKDMKRTDLTRTAGVSPSVITKLGKNEMVSLQTLVNICAALRCGIGDIVEVRHE